MIFNTHLQDKIILFQLISVFFFFQAEDGIRDAQESRGLGDVYKRQVKRKYTLATTNEFTFCGLDFKFTKGQLFWKIKDSILSKWKSKVNTGNSPRHALKLFGYVSRTSYIRLETNYYHRSSLRHVARLSRMCAKEEISWGKSHPLAIEAYNILASLVKNLDFRWSTIINRVISLSLIHI
eukprot:TRINITY_DN27865_c0_g1_i2.p1 TRINITY_DN27865_c0_g1~~TRINITY_DN27865_c0_g1_i2.p1  ORF type:complete len:180 (+),score=15.19 TRINITY_DN27865_c0_g1_i2:59-598(+)